MRERLLHCLLGVGCLVMIALRAPSTTGPTSAPVTRPTTTPAVVVPTPAAPPEKHEPVPPPPPPPTVTPVPEPPAPPASTTKPTAPVQAVQATTQPGPIPDPLAYGMGYAAGARIRARLAEDGRPADDLQIIAGMIAGLDGRDPAYSRAEIQSRFAEFQAYSLQRQSEKQYAADPAFRKRADDNLQKSRALMAQNAQMANVEVLPNGVQRAVIKLGTGRVIDGAKFVAVNLKVSLADGTLIKATDPDKPQKIAVADCLPALIDASRGMKVGGVWRVLIPPDKAYGLAGKPPVIGPNEAIEYEIDLRDAE